MATADGAAMPAAEGYRRMQEALRIRQLQEEAQRAAEREAALDPMRFPDETDGATEPLALPNPTKPYSPPARPSPAATQARLDTSRAVTRNMGVANTDAAVAASMPPPEMRDGRPVSRSADEYHMLRRRAERSAGPMPHDGMETPEQVQARIDAKYGAGTYARDMQRRRLEDYRQKVKAEFEASRPENVRAAAVRSAAGRTPPPPPGVDASFAAPTPVRPESGILPGEEQVATRDTLRQLTPEEQAALQRHYEFSGDAGTQGYDDWLSANFGDLPPAERIDAMQRFAASTPQANSRLARARVAAGKPLPEGREQNQYSPGQRRQMTRNTYSPEVPMGPFGGTFTHANADGALSSRAPNPADLEAAAQVAAESGNGSFAHLVALGNAVGIDTSRYTEDDKDILDADITREQERHNRLATKYKVVKSPMGGYRYTPNEAMKAQVDARRRLEFARTLITRYGDVRNGGLIDGAALAELAASPDGFDQMRQLGDLARLQLTGDQQAAYRARQNTFNMTRDMANPRFAPGMAVRSLVNAVNSGDPMQLGVAYDIAGNRRGARDAYDLAMAERAGAAQVAAARAANADATDDDKSVAAQFSDQIEPAMRLPAGQRYAAVSKILRAMNTPEAEIPERVSDIIMDYEIRTNPNGPVVKARVDALRSNPAQLRAFLERMGYGTDQIEAIVKDARTPLQRIAGFVFGETPPGGKPAKPVGDPYVPLSY